ncbi:MAG: hypothetical protein K5864_08590 [Bacteroidales bacterium]|nr:hypothetical protein [Bacteroidales bacterium]
MTKTHHNISLYFIVVGLFLLLISGTFLSEGMAHIGLDNAVIAKKMASGFEGFWLPKINSQASDPSGYLPLGYWLQSQWFHLVGDGSYLAEKFYSVLVFFLMGMLVVWIWKLLGAPKGSGWTPLFCLIMIPLVTWSATSNLLEGTMTLFVELAVVFILLGRNAATRAVARHVKRGGSAKRNAVHVIFTAYPPIRIVCAVLAALMLEMAFMVKGVMGIFPIIFPLIYWLFTRRERLLCPLFSVGVMVGTWILSLFAVMLFSPTVYFHLYNYLHHQLIGGVLHVQTVASHLYILYVLVVQLAIPLSVMIVLALIRARKMPLSSVLFYGKLRTKRKVNLTAEQINLSRMGWVFFTTGMVGVLPIMLGLKQQDFYIVPTLPFFAISLGCFFYNLLEEWLEHTGKLAGRLLAAFAVIFFLSGLMLNLNGIHKISSNADLLHDMKLILPMLDKGETISVSNELLQDPEVGEYFYRYKDINFTVDPCDSGHCDHPDHWQRYLLMEYSELKNLPEGICYRSTELSTRCYFLYERIDCPHETVLEDELLEQPMNENDDETETL